jgi:3-oxoacyl-[acyl-carrier-protein] synthase III
MTLSSTGINSANVIGQTLGGCATTLSSMIMAYNLVTANVYKNVMIVAIETLPSELKRFDKFAIYSDASVAFLVSSELRSGCDIISSTYKTSIAEILDGPGLQDPVLNKASVFQTLQQAGIKISDVEKVFSNNTFLPVKMFRERSIGFTDDQIDISNVANIGHCFSCDSLLNYYFYPSSGPEREHGYFLLFADSDGHSASVLIKGIASH